MQKLSLEVSIIDTSFVRNQRELFMSTSADLVTVLKKELKSAQMTYADLALALGHGGVQRQAHAVQRRHATVAH